MPSLPDVQLGTLEREEISLAAAMAARGMRDNPSSIALFGDDPLRRAQSLLPLYQWLLSSIERPPLVARRHGVLVGLAALAPPDRCFSRQAVERTLTVKIGGRRVQIGAIPYIPPRLILPLLRLGPARLSRLGRFGEVSFIHDPQQRHQHVELVTVEASLQGLGIGSIVMEALCREIDGVSDMAYLETDKPENVRFYERFGFEVTDEATVLGAHMWYMYRNRSVAQDQNP